MRAGDDAALLQASQGLDGELEGRPRRHAKRTLIFQKLGEAWSVAPGTLTLSSIVERATRDGVDVDRLERLREELRDATREQLRRGRRLAAMARYHQGVLAELMEMVFGATSKAGPEGRVPLIDAQA